MSMHPALPAENASATAYVVAAPRRSDVLAGTLRAAFTNVAEEDPFADLMCKLDRIDVTPQAL